MVIIWDTYRLQGELVRLQMQKKNVLMMARQKGYRIAHFNQGSGKYET